MWAARIVRVDIRETEIDEGDYLGYYVSAGDAVLLSPVYQRHGGALHPVSPLLNIASNCRWPLDALKSGLYERQRAYWLPNALFEGETFATSVFLRDERHPSNGEESTPCVMVATRVPGPYFVQVLGRFASKISRGIRAPEKA